MLLKYHVLPELSCMKSMMYRESVKSGFSGLDNRVSLPESSHGNTWSGERFGLLGKEPKIQFFKKD